MANDLHHWLPTDFRPIKSPNYAYVRVRQTLSPTTSTREVLAFSQGDKADIFDVWRRNYGGAGVRVQIEWAAALATSGTGIWIVEFAPEIEDQTDLDSDHFSGNSASVSGAVPASSGQPRYSQIDVTKAQLNGMLGGQGFVCRISRGNDGIGSELELLSVNVYEP